MGKQACIIFLILNFYLMEFCLDDAAAASDALNSSTDESSLLAIKAHITSDPNNILANNWSHGTSFCTWIGVTCSRRRPRVTVLNLFNMSLEGNIAIEIGNLSFLTYLDIRNNSFNGVIPDEIGNLPRLRRVLMSFNQLSGEIPLSFGFLTNLEFLRIQYNHLTGAIPWSIFNISSLQTIDLTGNQLYGTLPNDMCYSLPKLEGLYLSKNKLSGGIPTSLCACSQLNTISLSFNNFNGAIPMQMGNLSQLQRLSFFRNELTGTIPYSIGNLSNLMTLGLGENNFEGKIPIEMGLLSNIIHLGVGINKLNGEMPQSIFNLSRLEVLSLEGNELSGKLPLFVNRELPNLKWIYLGSNRFNGSIPYSISNLSNIITLGLSFNSFSGHVPINLGNLHNLEKLNLKENQFTNDLSIPEQDFLTPLARCRYLKKIVFAFNPITGLLPKSIGNFSTSLEFDASSSTISGIVPDEIGNMSSLISLDLAENELTGMIPSTLGQLRNLQRFRINDNKLWGSIPYNFCNLENLYYASLEGNSICGLLPSCIGNLVLLRELNMANNAFTSSIPSSLWSNKRIRIMNFSNNFFNGSLPYETGNLEGLALLDQSRNQFSGEIPSTFGQLESLNALVLSNNKLQGPIPDSFDNLKGLQYLDLSHNNLSGKIPKSLETLTDLSYFNVSFNELSGEIPEGGSFINFTTDLFRGNEGLCGASRFKVKACKQNKLKPSIKNIFLRYIVPPLVSITFAAIIVIMFLRYHARNSLLSQSSNSPPGLTHKTVSYYELLRATNKLDEGNLIGRGSIGSVYKGIFSNGTTAAVKVFDLDVQGAFKSFDIECQILSNIRHRNLVKVITSCSNIDFKALVLEYMPNGNLDQWLYSQNYFLNIAQRLGIMIDVASAIEYLHQGYSSPIIHCDLKPGNVLLDEDMAAHVGDFGIAKLLTNDRRMELTKTLGTIGYMAPEYGSEGLISTSVDVYSYGILLMETFTRKKPTDEMFLGQLTLRSWVVGSLPNGITKIIDVDLLNVDRENIGAKHEMLLTLIIELALACTTDSPEERLNIKDVVVKLKKIKL